MAEAISSVNKERLSAACAPESPVRETVFHRLSSEVEPVFRGVVGEHVARRQVDNQARPEQDIDPVERLNGLIEVLGLRVALILGRDDVILATR